MTNHEPIRSAAPASWQPTPIELRTPSIARMYDYLLGGKDNLRIDRQRVAEALAADPHLRRLAYENRAFLRRAVRFMAKECGIRQFLDIGTGLPTQENVHHVAQAIHPGARVVYVDNDPVVLAHGRALLAENDRTTVIQADLREPRAILENSEVRAHLDFARPLGLLLVATLHFVPEDDEPARIMTELRQALAPASYLTISHASADRRPETVGKVVEVYQRTATPGTARSREQIAGYFGDFELVEPGLVWVPQWRRHQLIKEAAAEQVWFLGGVGRKPGDAV